MTISPKIVMLKELGSDLLVEIVRDATRVTVRLYDMLVETDLGLVGRETERPAFVKKGADAIVGTHATKKAASPAVCALQPSPIISGPALGFSEDMRFLVVDEMCLDQADIPSFGKEWADYAAWGFPYSAANGGSIGTPFNRNTDTYISKIGQGRYRSKTVNSFPVFVMVPFKSYTFDKCSLIVNTSKSEASGTGLIGVVPNKTLAAPPGPREWFYPTISAKVPASVTPDGVATVEVSLLDEVGGLITDANCDLMLESVYGYLPKTRVKVVEGMATIKTHALGLVAGDEVRFKIGLGTVTGLADAIIPVM